MRRACAASALALSLFAPVCAQVPASRPASAVPPREVRAWLMRIHDAASHNNYHGTFVVSGGGNVASARIVHYSDRANQFERIEPLDGKARRVFRHNDVVQTVWPGSGVAMIEQRGLLNSFPALLQGGNDAITDHYDVGVVDEDRVAGHVAKVLAVRPRDDLRYGYRLWAEKQTGLLLRVDVLGERGDVLETSAFSDVTINVKPQPAAIVQAMKQLDGYRITKPVLTRTALEDEGWSLRQVAPGFRRVSCVIRQIGSPPDGLESGAEPVLQAIYSDGLTYVSLFIERFRPHLHVRPTVTSVGATQTLTKRQGDWWLTVVGDTPVATLRLFADALERRK
nr:MucB/RseB C-terminal domain-containing protein [Schlegelella koreensis]